ncbi:MAG TPA: hypothetical protein VIE89_02260 [Candidatus Binatia bacterium]
MKVHSKWLIVALGVALAQLGACTSAAAAKDPGGLCGAKHDPSHAVDHEGNRT